MSPKLELPSAPTWRPTFGRRAAANPDAADGDAPAEALDDAAAAVGDGAPEEQASRRKPAGIGALLLLLVVFVAVLLIRKRLADG